MTQGTNTTESYTYDPVGNRLSSLGVSPYSYNTSNELNSTPTTSYIYDHNGNTTSKTDSTGATTYGWDFENRLTSVTLPGTGGTVSFKYDLFGRRVQKSFTSGANPPTTTTTNYVYDGDRLVEEVDPNGNVLARYSQGLNIDEPLAMLRSGATSYYHADGLGSVTSLSNPAGAVAQTYTFDSFGKQTGSSGSFTNSFRYTAREFDSETNLYFYRARYFDSNVGRFISEDPIGFGGGINFYAYVFNNATDRTDPEGLRTRVCCRAVGNAAAGLKKANHCSIAIDGNPAINGGALTVFSLFPANYSLSSDSGVGVPHMNDPRDLAPIIEGVSRCTDVPDCGSCNEQKILQSAAQQGDAGPSQNYHTLWSHNYGPNSNTFVPYTLKKAGCKPPKLPVNAPGYDFPLP